MRSALAVLLLLVLAACDSATSTPDEIVEAESPTGPEAVAEALIDALRADDPSLAASLADPAQIPLLAIAEGLGTRGLNQLTPADLDLVASNFWSGFAAQLRTSLGTADLAVGEVAVVEVGASRFGVVELERPPDASIRRLVLRETPDGWLVDLVASFPFPLLGRFPEAADLARAADNQDLRDSLTAMEDSVLFVLEDPDVAPQLHQAAVAALESIGR